MSKKIPVTVISGFLGSGKTTLLNRLLDGGLGAESRRTLVLINEVGQAGLDHKRVRHLRDSVVLIEGGCLCCTVRGELVDTLRGLFMSALRREIPAFARVIVETSGIADPAPVMYTLQFDPFLRDRYVYGGCITVVDGVRGLPGLAVRPEAARQAALADALVVSKGDLVGAEAMQALQQVLAAQYPGALVTDAAAPGTIATWLLAPEILRQAGRRPDASPPGGALFGIAADGDAPQRAGTPSGPRTSAAPDSKPPGSGRGPRAAHGLKPLGGTAPAPVQTLVARWRAPLERAGMLRAISALQEKAGAGLLRIKGELHFQNDEHAWDVDGVHGQLYPLIQREAEASPGETGAGDSVLVLIFQPAKEGAEAGSDTGTSAGADGGQAEGAGGGGMQRPDDARQRLAQQILPPGAQWLSPVSN